MLNSQKAAEIKINGMKFRGNFQSVWIKEQVKIIPLIKIFINKNILEAKTLPY